jgi:hypothetical protein
MAMAVWINERTTTLFWAALGAGFVMLVGGGIAAAANLLPAAISLLIIVGAISIVLGAFGATASVNYQGVTLAGVAALCVVLFYIVMPEVRNPSVRVEITGFPQGSLVDFYAGGSHFLGAYRGEHHDLYEFAVFADELKANVLGLTVTAPKLDDGKDPEESVFGCIDKSLVSRALGSSVSMQWSVDLKKNQLVTNDKKADLISSGGRCSGATPEMSPKLIAWMRLLSPISSALAGADAANVKASIRDLTAESSPVRNDARRSIGAAGPPAIKPLMASWKEQPNEYRVRLGSVVSLVEMMRTMKSDKKSIGIELENDDLRLIIGAAADPDRTIRIYATEFLYDLADPRTAAIVLESISKASPDGQYNMALILSSVAAEMSAPDRAALKKQLAAIDKSAFGDKTRAQLDGI